MQLKKRTGFSRWELLASGVVSCVISAFLLPVLAQSRTSAQEREAVRSAVCVSNLKQLAIGMKMYVEDYDNYYPIVVSTSGAPKGDPPFGWADAIWPYVRVLAVYQCPSESNKGQSDPRKAGFTDYWYNGYLAHFPMAKMRTPQSDLLLGDGGSRDSNARYSLKALPKSWLSIKNSPARRHEGGACYAFADAHAKCLAAKDIGTKTASFIVR